MAGLHMVTLQRGSLKDGLVEYCETLKKYQNDEMCIFLYFYDKIPKIYSKEKIQFSTNLRKKIKKKVCLDIVKTLNSWNILIYISLLGEPVWKKNANNFPL